MEQIKLYLIESYNELINKVNLFGFYFASLDIRQNGKIHDNVIQNLIAELELNMGLSGIDDIKKLDTDLFKS